MKKNIDIPEDLIDYYVFYSIDRRKNTKEIRKILLQKQGEIRSNMANGSLNSEEILKKLQEAYNEIANAVKVFKNDERRKKYDTLLDAAYNEGKIDVEAQNIAQSLYEEIEALFMKGNYNIVIRKCMDALDNNVRDYRIYILLAQSYYALKNPDRSIATVEDGLKANPDNLQLLKAGARFANEGKKDYSKAQEFVNKIYEVEPEGPIAASEQSYLYLSMGKEDLAYKLIDDYMERHPGDMDFRRDVAYDIIGYSYTYYTLDPSSEAYVIASEEDYQSCLKSCNKALSIYNDDNVREALDNAEFFGTIEFNTENKENILWLFICGVIYILGAVFVLLSDSAVAAIFMLLLGVLLIYSGVKLKKVSYRPYWQINKFILTGKREKEENKYIIIGKIFSGYMKASIKLGWKFIRLVFDMMFMFLR